jgi:hypothetical protein
LPLTQGQGQATVEKSNNVTRLWVVNLKGTVRPDQLSVSDDPHLHGYDENDSSTKTDRCRETGMTRETIQQKLRDIKGRSLEALRLFGTDPMTLKAHNRVKALVQELQEELGSEYDRLRSSATQKSLSLFEACVYTPCIAELWTKSGIAALDATTQPDRGWHVALEAVALLAQKRLI